MSYDPRWGDDSGNRGAREVVLAVGVRSELSLRLSRTRCWPAFSGTVMTAEIEPRGVLESSTLHHQRVALPAADRIAHEARVEILRGQRPAVEKILNARQNARVNASSDP